MNLTNQKVYKRSDYFKVLYLAIYRLMMDNYFIDDPKKTAEIILGHKSLFVTDVSFNFANVNNMIDKAENLSYALRGGLTLKIERETSEMEKEVDALLSASLVENANVEFKIGVSDFSSGEISKKAVRRFLNTLHQMYNNSDTCYLIIGIADNAISYNNWDKQYNGSPVLVNGHYITGIVDEATRLYGVDKTIAVDRYRRNLNDLIANSDLSSDEKTFFKDRNKSYSYHGTEIIVFKKSAESSNIKRSRAFS